MAYQVAYEVAYQVAQSNGPVKWPSRGPVRDKSCRFCKSSRLQKYRLTEKGRQMLAQKGKHK